MNKPLSRRLFGKAMAAVPLAVSEAPKLAAQSMSTTTAFMGTAAKEYDGRINRITETSDAEWRAQRTKELQAIIDGKEDDYEREINGSGPFVAHHYDSLRSISPGARAVLFHRENQRRAKAARISWAQRELANLVRKFF